MTDWSRRHGQKFKINMLNAVIIIVLSAIGFFLFQHNYFGFVVKGLILTGVFMAGVYFMLQTFVKKSNKATVFFFLSSLVFAVVMMNDVAQNWMSSTLKIELYPLGLVSTLDGTVIISSANLFLLVVGLVILGLLVGFFRNPKNRGLFQ